MEFSLALKASTGKCPDTRSVLEVSSGWGTTLQISSYRMQVRAVSPEVIHEDKRIGSVPSNPSQQPGKPLKEGH